MAFVFKIKYEDNLRRLTVKKNEIETNDFTFAHLEARIRELFQLAATAPLAVTYTDEENDVVTMGDNQDLKDALVEQSLNPLRLHVTLSKSKSGENAETQKGAEAAGSDKERLVQRTSDLDTLEQSVQTDKVALEKLLRTFSSSGESSDTLEQSVQRDKVALEKLLRTFSSTPESLRNAFQSPTQIPGLVENVLQSIATQVTSAVKNGASAAAAAAPEFGERADVLLGRALSSRWGRMPQFGEEPPAVPAGAASENRDSLKVHQGVTCDVCGASPIVGMRWKSMVKYDYDLCQPCFEKEGSKKDYAKVEEPKFRPRHMQGPPRSHVGPPPPYTSCAYPNPMGHMPPMGLVPPFSPGFSATGPRFHAGRSFGLRGRHHCHPMMGPGFSSADSKLYARFVCDVTVFDGTEVAPGTEFVKIWRLRNSGSAPWPVNTSLVFVGGDELGHVVSVPLEIPEQGLAPEAEMEASVDMVAPEKPGRYVSHWRLASPAGPKFGQRLSVVIQVLPKTSDDSSAEFIAVGDDAPAQEPESAAGTSSQTPAEPAEFDGQELDEIVTGMMSFIKNDDDEAAMNAANSAALISGGENGAGKELGVEQEEKPAEPKAIETSPAVEGSITYPVLDVTKDQGRVTYPVVDTTEDNFAAAVARVAAIGAVAPVAPVAAEDSFAAAVAPVAAEEADVVTTKALVTKLETMGFTDAKLNAELLEKNGFDLRKTLDDLCAAEEWDPILEELEEMGFYDTVMNRRLMFKNNGSVKRVVKELVQMYRDIQGKREKVE